MFQENKACQIFRKRNISCPLIRTRRCAYQGVRNVPFLENLACYVFLKPPFWGSSFCLIIDNIKNVVKKDKVHKPEEATILKCSFKKVYLKNSEILELSNLILLPNYCYLLSWASLVFSCSAKKKDVVRSWCTTKSLCNFVPFFHCILINDAMKNALIHVSMIQIYVINLTSRVRCVFLYLLIVWAV